jgi:chemotaxis protein CheC
MTLVALSERHVDALREFSNIGVGHAATALSQLIAKPVSMRVPKVNITAFHRVPEVVGGAETLVAGIHFRVMGNVTGDILVVFPEDAPGS